MSLNSQPVSSSSPLFLLFHPLFLLLLSFFKNELTTLLSHLQCVRVHLSLFLEKCLFKFLAHVSVVPPLLLSCESSFCILHMDSLIDMWFSAASLPSCRLSLCSVDFVIYCLETLRFDKKFTPSPMYSVSYAFKIVSRACSGAFPLLTFIVFIVRFYTKSLLVFTFFELV